MCFRWPWWITALIRTTQTSPPRAPRGLVVGLPPPSWCCSPRWLWPLFSSTGPDWVDWPRWTQKPAQVTLRIECWLSLNTLISQSTHPPTQKRVLELNFKCWVGKLVLKGDAHLHSALSILCTGSARTLNTLAPHRPFYSCYSGRTPQTRVQWQSLILVSFAWTWFVNELNCDHCTFRVWLELFIFM